MNPLKRGLEAVKAVRKNKSVFAVLILVQILFIISVSFVGIRYQLKIYENVKGIIGPWETMDYSKMENLTAEEASGPLKSMMKEMVSVIRSYEEMIKNIFKMVFFIFGCFLLFNGFSWSLTNYVIKKKVDKKVILTYWKRFVLVSLVFLVPVSLISYLVLKSMAGVDLDIFGQVIKIFYFVFLVMSYFMLVGFCLVEERLKELLKKIFLIGLKQIHWILLSLSFVLGGVLLSLMLVYLAGNNFWLMTLGVVVLVVVLVLGRFFMVGVVKELKG